MSMPGGLQGVLRIRRTLMIVVLGCLYARSFLLTLPDWISISSGLGSRRGSLGWRVVGPGHERACSGRTHWRRIFLLEAALWAMMFAFSPAPLRLITYMTARSTRVGDP